MTTDYVIRKLLYSVGIKNFSLEEWEYIANIWSFQFSSFKISCISLVSKGPQRMWRGKLNLKYFSRIKIHWYILFDKCLSTFLTWLIKCLVSSFPLSMTYIDRLATQLSLVPLLNVFTIIGTYSYTKYLRTVCINIVASKPEIRLHFITYNFEDIKIV